MRPRISSFDVIKPPPGARVDLTHPLGRACQAACLFNEGQGTPTVAGPVGALTFLGGPQPQYYQTQGGRTSMVFGSTVPTWTANAAGKAMLCNGVYSGMDVGLVPNCESYDLDYPETAIGGTVTHGETVCVIRRKLDTTARASTLFGVEGPFQPAGVRCGAHVPYSDGTVYWDYGGAGGANRLFVSGLTFTTKVEKWTFCAGSRGSSIWRDGIRVANQTTALTRLCVAQVAQDGGWVINGGNGLHVSGSADLQEINFFMFLATQWSDDQCRWWAAEPYAAFVTDRRQVYSFLGFPAAEVAASSWIPITPTQIPHRRTKILSEAITPFTAETIPIPVVPGRLAFLPDVPDHVYHHRFQLTELLVAPMTAVTIPVPAIDGALAFLPTFPSTVPHHRPTGLRVPASAPIFTAALAPTSWLPTYPSRPTAGLAVRHRVAAWPSVFAPPVGEQVVIGQRLGWQPRFPATTPHRRPPNEGGSVMAINPRVVAAGTLCVEWGPEDLTSPAFVQETLTTSILIDETLTAPALINEDLC